MVIFSTVSLQLAPVTDLYSFSVLIPWYHRVGWHQIQKYPTTQTHCSPSEKYCWIKHQSCGLWPLWSAGDGTAHTQTYTIDAASVSTKGADISAHPHTRSHLALHASLSTLLSCSTPRITSRCLRGFLHISQAVFFPILGLCRFLRGFRLDGSDWPKKLQKTNEDSGLTIKGTSVVESTPGSPADSLIG